MDEELPELLLPIEERDHVIGPLSARYSLIEYGDYESPQCREVAAIVRELVRELEDDLCFAFRNYPQPKIHPVSQVSAEAVEAAGFQGKFWLMHDRVFDHQDDLNEQKLRELAEELPVDMTVFERDIASGEAARRIAEDVDLALQDGVGDTPVLFVNGTLHEGKYEFLPLLDALQRSPRK